MKKNFDLNEAITEVATALGIKRAGAEAIIRQFLDTTSNALAEHGAVHYKNHFSILLRHRAARSGTIAVSGERKPWSTPQRVEPEFEASKKLKALVEEKQGLPCA